MMESFLSSLLVHHQTKETRKERADSLWFKCLFKTVSQHDIETHLISTLSKFDPAAILGIIASNIGTEASNILKYHFQAVCSIYLIPLSGKKPIVCEA